MKLDQSEPIVQRRRQAHTPYHPSLFSLLAYINILPQNGGYVVSSIVISNRRYINHSLPHRLSGRGGGGGERPLELDADAGGRTMFFFVFSLANLL